MIKKIITVLILSGCGKLSAIHHPAEPSAAPAAAPLAAAYEVNLKFYQDATTANAGLPSITDCDTAVWAGTAQLGGIDVGLSKLEYPAGTLNRRPTTPCWVLADAGKQQPSSSTASRDDVTLYAAGAFDKGDRGALERLLAYANANDGYIGLPKDLGLTFLGPNLTGVIARAITKLGGSASGPEYTIEAPGIKDYQQHIEAEEILFSAAVAGAASDLELEELKVLVAGAPSDGLFQAALGVYTGDCDKAPHLLLDPTTPIPSYVRGDQPALFAKAWWLRAAKLVLNHCKES